MGDDAGQQTSGEESVATRAAWRGAWAEAQHGLGAARGFTPPPIGSHLRRLAYGAALPIAVGKAVMRDPAARRSYLRVATIQAVLIWTLALGFTVAATLVAKWLDGEHQAGSVRVVSDGHVGFFVTLVSALYTIEWLVVAVSRDYHDLIGRTASVLTGVPPESGEAPRIRLNLPWTWRRVKRYLRGIKVFACAMPLIGIVQIVPAIGSVLYAVLAAVWGFYWLVVFNLAKSELAWRSEEAIVNELKAYETSLAVPGAPPPPAPWAPWFLRLWDGATTRVPGLRWWLPRWYGRIWRRWSSSSFPACASVEDAPYEAAGLGLARLVLGAVPGVYMFLRPLVPVAAAHAIVAPERRAEVAAPAQAPAPA